MKKTIKIAHKKTLALAAIVGLAVIAGSAQAQKDMAPKAAETLISAPETVASDNGIQRILIVDKTNVYVYVGKVSDETDPREKGWRSSSPE